MADIKTTKRDFPLEKVRNIGIIAHIDAGKTTTTERILFDTGLTYKHGSVDEGTTITDWMEQERERGITIVSAAITTFWKDHRINIIDTPGHVDFTVEVERSLRVLDGAVMIFDGKMGVEAQSETVWHQADKYHVPRLCFINKLNLVGGDFYKSLDSIQKKLGANVYPIWLPIGIEYELKGAVNLINMKAYTYKDQEDNQLTEAPIPADLKEKAQQYRSQLIEKVAEYDDQALEKYLEGKDLSEDELKKAIRAGTITGKFFPVMGGDSRMCIINLLMDAVLDFLPSPLDVPPVEGLHPQTQEKQIRKTDNSQPFSSLAFKIQTDPHIGRLTYIRVYSGTINAGSYVYNSTTEQQERIGRLVLMHADKRELIEQAFAGEIVAVVGLKNTTTGDTLCDPNQPILLENITFPEPVISLAIEPKTKSDQEKISQALNKLGEEDPTFRIKTNQETGQTIISGMGELHLEIIVDRMKREFKVEANTGATQVAHKETITDIATAEGKYIRQTGGRGQYGHCLLRVEPRGRGEGFEFKSEIRGAAIPNEYIPAIEKGVKEALENGIISGYPLVDIKVVVYDGSYHDVDSSEIAFHIAGSMAVQSAVKRAHPILLEPIMKVEVSTPDEFLGDIIGDLSSKRAQIQSTEKRGMITTVLALVPLAELTGYSTRIRSLSQGRASYYMEPSHYEPVPPNITENLIASSGKSKKD